MCILHQPIFATGWHNRHGLLSGLPHILITKIDTDYMRYALVLVINPRTDPGVGG